LWHVFLGFGPTRALLFFEMTILHNNVMSTFRYSTGVISFY